MKKTISQPKDVLERLSRVGFESRYFPWLLLFVSILAYGTLIWDLGFYWDGWEILFLSKAAQTPADIFLYPFRPLHVLLDIFTVNLLGLNPLPWHLLMLAIRYFGGIFFWLLLKEIWPEHPRRNAWAALIFLVYPSFLQQSMGVVYRQHFTSAMLYMLSAWLMARAFRLRGDQQKRLSFWICLILSLISGLLQLFVTEYFAAMELWRVVILIVILLPEKQSWLRRLRQALRFCLPYLFYLIGYVIWRLAYVKTVIEDPNKAVFLDQLAGSPIKALIGLVQSAIQDSTYMLVTSWSNAFKPEEISLSSANIMIFGISLIGGILIYLLLRGNNEQAVSHATSPALLGLVGMVLGMVPAWTIGRQLFLGRYDTRFSIPALAGASLLVVTSVFMLTNHKSRAVLLSVLVALGIVLQIQMTNTFRWDWTRASRVFWQIQWRAPEIASNTALLANKSASSYTTKYPVAYAINLLKSDQAPSLTPEYWWFEIYESRLYTKTKQLLAGDEINITFHEVTFSTSSQNVLLFDIPQGEDITRCVWMLTPLDTNNRQIAPEMRDLAPLANLSLIGSGDIPENYFITLGAEPTDNWCYYYQKASLAQQMGKWQEVLDLYQQAAEQSFNYANGYEAIPFISANAHLGSWDQAVSLTKDANTKGLNQSSMLCAVWQSFETDLGEDENYAAAYQQVTNKLDCRE